MVGARNSSNSNRLREVGSHNGLPSYLIEDAGEMDPLWFKDKLKVGITAGASTPEILVQGVVRKMHGFGTRRVSEMDGEQETIRFSLPNSPHLRSEVVMTPTE